MLLRVATMLVWAFATAAAAQDEYVYPGSSRGPRVLLPYGAMSFADTARFEPNDWRSGESRSDPSRTIGAPDNDFVSLGCGPAHLIVQFTDNVLRDVQGPDLYVFEFGPQREATAVEISVDGRSWIPVGRAEGATTGIDIQGHTGDYRYVRLTNLSESCGRSTPGADIDAVAAIGAGPLEFLFDSSVLFDTNQATLRTDAPAALEEFAAELQRRNPARAFVIGHADSVGDDRDNLILSEQRAATVQAYLTRRLPNAEIRTFSYGETRPLASNDDEDGRARNRRVEVLIVPRHP